MRRPSWLRKSGPFKCTSFANGLIEVKPAWSQYDIEWTADGGGGPGFAGRMRLAADLERWLNAPFTGNEVDEGLKRIRRHDRELAKAKKEWDAKQKPSSPDMTDEEFTAMVEAEA